MPNLNRVFLAGNLTRDPELRYTPDGIPVCNFGLAINRVFNTKGGEKKKEVLFVDIEVWRKQAENCAEYLKKGRPILAEGRLKMDTWENKEGQKRSKLRVVAFNVQFLRGGRPDEKTVSEETESPEEPREALPEEQAEENIPF